MGVPNPGTYKELINSDDVKYGGTGVKNGSVKSVKGPMHGFDQHIEVTLPPLSTIYFSVPAARKKAGKPARQKLPKQPNPKRQPSLRPPKLPPPKSAQPNPWQQNRLLKSPERQNNQAQNTGNGIVNVWCVRAVPAATRSRCGRGDKQV